MRADTADVVFENLRRKEFSRLDERGIAYLDFAASALYGASQVAEYSNKLLQGVFGNPHSEHGPSKASEADLECARAATLQFFDADPGVYDVCFTANTSMAIKLVAESYPFGPNKGLILSADNHNSMNGIREYARAAGAPSCVLPLSDDLRLMNPGEYATEFARSHGPGLFGFPAQSNFSGVKHSLDLVAQVQRLGYDVLLDAAGLGCGNVISLQRYPAEFLVFSFYKLFGLPTGVGALVARRDALKRLKRPWFAGGTVDFVSIEHDRHQLRAGHSAFEDGTPNFLNLGAIEAGFDFVSNIDRSALALRLDRLTAQFIKRARTLIRSDGTPLVRLYGPASMDGRGATVAFNLLQSDGSTIAYQSVETRSREMGVAVRGGCFCNPGAAESAFNFRQLDLAHSLDALKDGFTPDRLRTRLGHGATVGAIRLSIGLPTIEADIDRALQVVESFG
ncbi:MAG TPA: aminotransferase class V-fold PLP-dependent enzyme [Steroidobacteraceae bacterium]|nr:aminotransferase class V-fold PLP-dependent enzyme [Steroidobacteraceae bacterium]